MDYYPSFGDYNPNYVALNSNGANKIGWTKTANCGINNSIPANILSPSKLFYVANKWTDTLNIFHPTWAYIDVHTSKNPGENVDYNFYTDSAGYFKYVLSQYRKLAEVIRNKINGPVQGEGNNHFLFAGYYDDFEPRLYTGSESLYGKKAPLLLDFDMYKIRPKSALHGVEHYSNFFAETSGTEYTPPQGLNDEELLTYIATEIAYGHSPLITKINIQDHMLKQFLLEYQHTYQIQKYIYDKTPISITYYDQNNIGYTASDYIRTYRYDWDNENSSNFMSKVKITYPNGVIVYVNRHPNNTMYISDNFSNGIFFYCLNITNQGISNSFNGQM